MEREDKRFFRETQIFKTQLGNIFIVKRIFLEIFVLTELSGDYFSNMHSTNIVQRESTVKFIIKFVSKNTKKKC